MKQLVRLNSASVFLTADNQGVVIASGYRIIEYAADGARVLKAGRSRCRAQEKPSRTSLLSALGKGSV